MWLSVWLAHDNIAYWEQMLITNSFEDDYRISYLFYYKSRISSVFSKELSFNKGIYNNRHWRPMVTFTLICIYTIYKYLL